MNKILNFKNFVVFSFTLALLLGLGAEADAQRRSRKKRNKQSDSIMAQRKKGAEDVGIQVKNLTKFVFVLGGVAAGIEQIDKDIREGKASREIAAQNNRYKSDVIRSIRAIRAALVKLEVDFRAKKGLKPYLSTISGIIEGGTRAEDSALAGNFKQSGKELLLVIETLTDVLVKMP